MELHLRQCATCRAQEQDISRRAQAVGAALELLASSEIPTSSDFAFARWRARHAGTAAFSFGMFQPANPRERWPQGWLASLLVHVGVAGLVFAAGTNPAVQQMTRESVRLIAPVLLPVQKTLTGGGGGGGDRSLTPPDRGRLPRSAPRQFTPPPQVVQNLQPKLTIEPTIDVPPDLHLVTNLHQLGNPLDGRALPSNGPGSGGGIGTGRDGGIGSGRSTGVGPGSGGGFAGGAFSIGGGVSQPVLVYKADPEYSEEARKAKFQGTVLLTVVVDAAGHVSNIQVARSLGLGLDEKAIEAVRKWRFRPAQKDGRPVPVIANVEVNFRLL